MLLSEVWLTYLAQLKKANWEMSEWGLSMEMCELYLYDKWKKLFGTGYMSIVFFTETCKQYIYI